MSNSRKMTHARIMNSLLRASECGAAGVLGSAAIASVAGNSLAELGETAVIAAIGGLVTGYLEKPQEFVYQSASYHRQYYGLRPIVRYGITTLSAGNSERRSAPGIAHELLTDAVMNFISIGVGFLMVGGADYIARHHFGQYLGQRTEMTLGTLFRNAAIGTVPISLTISLVLKVSEIITSVSRTLFGEQTQTYHDLPNMYSKHR